MNKKKTTTKKGDRSTGLCMAQQNWELRETGKFALEKPRLCMAQQNWELRETGKFALEKPRLWPVPSVLFTVCQSAKDL
ncbi:hypothetical protein CFP56_027710 [Quercus suber]|uniref:Uncharacterized protein n=1 Tax=Quercus suber TaxID=58331 RepID=A0AAW0JWX6_QUESU